MEDIRLYEELLKIKKSGQSGVLLTVVESQGSTPRKTGAKMLIREDGSTLGTVGGGAVELLAKDKASEVLRSGQSEVLDVELTEKHGLTCGGRVRVYLEPLARVPQLLVVGKGHIAQALQHLAPHVGFAVTLLEAPEDEKSDVSFADNFAQQANLQEVYVVIACPTHRQDFIAAKAAIDGAVGFVGVVGSKRKRQNMLTWLLENGCDKAAGEAVYSPVGLDIGAETPAEIALSIMAQLISKRRAHAR